MGNHMKHTNLSGDIMKTEFQANNSLALEIEIKNVQQEIRNYCGIVPQELWNKLDTLERQQAGIK